MKQYTALLLLILTCLSARAQTGTLGSGCFTNPPNFVKLAYGAADSAVIEEDRNIYWGSKKICPEYVTNLVNQLRYGRLDNDKKVLAIWLLGDVIETSPRSLSNTLSYAAGLLTEMVDLKADKIDPKSLARRWGVYPSTEALIKIGKPALNAIYQCLPNETNDIRIHLFCHALVRIEGYDRPHFDVARGRVSAKKQIERLVADETNSFRLQNLKKALIEVDRPSIEYESLLPGKL